MNNLNTHSNKKISIQETTTFPLIVALAIRYYNIDPKELYNLVRKVQVSGYQQSPVAPFTNMA